MIAWLLILMVIIDKIRLFAIRSIRNRELYKPDCFPNIRESTLN